MNVSFNFIVTRTFPDLDYYSTDYPDVPIQVPEVAKRPCLLDNGKYIPS